MDSPISSGGHHVGAIFTFQRHTVNETGASVQKDLQLPADMGNIIGRCQNQPIRRQHLFFYGLKVILLTADSFFVTLIACQAGLHGASVQGYGFAHGVQTFSSF